MSRRWLGTVALVSACGRVGFDGASDAAVADAAVADALPRGAVLYLPFETDPSSTIEDLARGHTVTCRTTCPSVTMGQRGNAYAFDPNNPDVLEVPFTADLDPSGGLTIAVWIYMRVLPPTAYFCVLGKPIGNGSSNSHALCVENTGRAFYHSGTAAGTDNLTGSNVPIQSWHHLAMTWDGTTKRGYLDGVPDGTKTVPVENDGNPISIGADLNGGTPTYPLDGALDEAWVFDRPLDVAEIAALASPGT